jgi:DNA-binding NtrC family response regulator
VKKSNRILLIDDNPAVAGAIEIAFRLANHRVTVAAGPEEGLSELARRDFDAIVLDLNFTPGAVDGTEGLASLRRILADDPAACVIVLTAHGGIRTAVAAMQSGARDFAVKPWKNAELVAKVEHAIAAGPMLRHASSVPISGRHVPVPRILGESAAIVRLRDVVRRIGPTLAGVAIAGPPGAGRMLTARALHSVSTDRAEPPAVLDLREGTVRLASLPDRGTVILRFPEQLDVPEQDQLAAELSDDIRPIAILDRYDDITPGLRRRIATIELSVPPLADRREDIPLLARHFLSAAADRHRTDVPHLTDAALAAVVAADWPDNVRGLALAMERAVLLADGDSIDVSGLALARPLAAEIPAEAAATTRYDLAENERAVIEAALREHRHNVSHAARALGLSRGALYRRMERHGL